MKTEDVPQDLGYMRGTVVRDLTYAVDADGRYRTVQSDGWQPKTTALDVTLAAIDEDCEEIRRRVMAGETSPLEYHAAANFMDIGLLSDYTGFSKRTIRRHYDPDTFRSLDAKTLETYADVLRITVDELTHMPD